MKTRKKLEYTLFIAWATALTATLGSLYFSEILGYIPCNLCWYQRIFMYPMVILFGVALIRKETTILHYAAPLAFFGSLLSAYHYFTQKVPFFQEIAPSCGQVPCTGQYINWLGFITIPFLALIAFLIIIVACIYMLKLEKEMN
ncbi:disulfide oxidoreductase [Priestia taiwanensis]|uniref:Probable disulfide formation protein n=1 Tax=Priestia taiwanensis TaxID=1347902 RepID=A0A917AT48_9BACI|nr:disulfide oxidoreductase [Priestia taiwanensis]MBM7364310.1 disulfide bond formation protein DsbB [Priestia taiwanensis]GGE73435.1 putative disulfide formation protein [Priestia taiwanensis]